MHLGHYETKIRIQNFSYTLEVHKTFSGNWTSQNPISGAIDFPISKFPVPERSLMAQPASQDLNLSIIMMEIFWIWYLSDDIVLCLLHIYKLKAGLIYQVSRWAKNLEVQGLSISALCVLDILAR